MRLESVLFWIKIKYLWRRIIQLINLLHINFVLELKSTQKYISLCWTHIHIKGTKKVNNIQLLTMPKLALITRKSSTQCSGNNHTWKYCKRLAMYNRYIPFFTIVIFLMVLFTVKEQEYLTPIASIVVFNVNNFVTLYSQSRNYPLWKEQIMALVENQDLVDRLTDHLTPQLQ